MKLEYASVLQNVFLKWCENRESGRAERGRLRDRVQLGQQDRRRGRPARAPGAELRTGQRAVPAHQESGGPGEALVASNFKHV